MLVVAETLVAVAALIGALSSAIAAAASLANGRRGKQIHQEVRTMNELTLGQLGEAVETRRIEEIRPADRTAQEDRHLQQKEERSGS